MIAATGAAAGRKGHRPAAAVIARPLALRQALSSTAVPDSAASDVPPAAAPPGGGGRGWTPEADAALRGKSRAEMVAFHPILRTAQVAANITRSCPIVEQVETLAHMRLPIPFPGR